MDKVKWNNLVNRLTDTADNRKYDRDHGSATPAFNDRFPSIKMDDVRKMDPKLAELLTKVEASHKEVDDYILSRKEVGQNG